VIIGGSVSDDLIFGPRGISVCAFQNCDKSLSS
jgi:hypothetical protein